MNRVPSTPGTGQAGPGGNVPATPTSTVPTAVPTASVTVAPVMQPPPQQQQQQQQQQTTAVVANGSPGPGKGNFRPQGAISSPPISSAAAFHPAQVATSSAPPPPPPAHHHTAPQQQQGHGQQPQPQPQPQPIMAAAAPGATSPLNASIPFSMATSTAMQAQGFNGQPIPIYVTNVSCF